MQCKKCSYIEQFQSKFFGSSLCSVCKAFAPNNPIDFQNYIMEKVDWKILDTFRNHGQGKEAKQKQGMDNQAKVGKLQSRPPWGYKVKEGKMLPNEDVIKVRLLYKIFTKENHSLNHLAKKFSLSVSGLKKILTNRTYLGEIKFNGKIYKGHHQAIINQEIFYAAQRKLKGYLKPR